MKTLTRTTDEHGNITLDLRPTDGLTGLAVGIGWQVVISPLDGGRSYYSNAFAEGRRLPSAVTTARTLEGNERAARRYLLSHV